MIVACTGNVNTESEDFSSELVPDIVLPTDKPTNIPTEMPSPTATNEPTLEPTTEPTFTPTPELSLMEEGLQMWSIPQGNVYFTSSTKYSQDFFPDASLGYIEKEKMNVRVPASMVVVEVAFNQEVPEDLVFKVFYLNTDKEWLSAAINRSTENPNKGYFLLNHNFILDPPFWEITYLAKLVGSGDKVFWEKDLRLFKPLPNSCWDGSLPDPVTFYCLNYDGDWNYRDFPNFNPNADIFTSGQVELGEEYKK